MSLTDFVMMSCVIICTFVYAVFAIRYYLNVCTNQNELDQLFSVGFKSLLL